MIENWEDAAFETDGRVTTFRTAHKEFCNSSFRCASARWKTAA